MMLNLLCIPKECILNKQIPSEKIYSDEDKGLLHFVDKITLRASIKPGLTDVVPIVEKNKRYEEIEILHVVINSVDNVYSICRPIFKKIKYACLILIQYQEKFILAACPFESGKIDKSENILKGILVSHWIYPNLISMNCQQFIDEVNHAIDENKNIYDMYSAICCKIENFHISGITKAHVERLTYDMTGNKTISGLLQNCTPYKMYFSTDHSKHSKYKSLKRTSQYKLCYDEEDLWYSFCNNEITAEVIIGRRYRNISELIVSIDIKFVESDLLC